MQTAHQIAASFIAASAIDMKAFHQWFQDSGYSQCEANIYDTCYLTLLEHYVEERNAEPMATLPRILNKYTRHQNFLRSRRSYPLPNQVEHFVYFPNFTAAEIFVDTATAEGFSIGAEKHDIGPQLLIMVYTRDHNPADEIARIAEACAGTYDGSGSLIH